MRLKTMLAGLSSALRSTIYIVLCCHFHNTHKDVSDIWIHMLGRSLRAQQAVHCLLAADGSEL